MDGPASPERTGERALPDPGERPLLRPFGPSDLDALVALAPGATRAGLEEHLDHPPYYDPGRDMRLAEADGALVAARDVRVMARGDEPRPILESWGVARPAAWAGAAPRALFAWMLERAGEVLAELGRREGVLQVRAAPDEGAARALFESFGLVEVRRLWSMECPRPGALEPPALPAGLVVRPYAPGRHDEAWRRAFNDAFADHWGGWMQLSAPFWRRYVARPSFRPDLSLVAWDGEEIAGFCHCRLEGGGLGQLRYLGVRPGWRRRGLGEALTRLGMLALARAGAERVGLGVDATNTTGAQLLYQQLGFAVTREQVMYRKELRG
jgi:ribosomal protein S18 acetylase RimI-like enzyme